MLNTHTHVVSGNIPSSTETLLILLMPAFLCKKLPFFGKNNTFTQIISVKASEMTSSSNVFDVVLSLLWSFVTGPSFTSIPSLVPELWQFSFIRDWPEIQNSEITPSEFCPTTRDWGKFGILNLVPMFLIKCYWM